MLKLEALDLRFGEYSYKTTRYNNPNASTRMLYLGGAFQNAANFHRLAKNICQHVSLDVIELPGLGTTPLLEENYGFDFFTEVLNDYCRVLNYESIGIAGVSYGGPIAWDFAARSTRVDSLVLVGCMRIIPDDLKVKISSSIALANEGKTEQLGKLIVELLLNSNQKKTIENYRFVERILLGGLSHLSPIELKRYAFNTQRLLEHELDFSVVPQCRTMCFVGEYDSFTRPELCQEASDRLPNAQLYKISNTDHLFHLEKPSLMHMVVASIEPQWHQTINSIEDFVIQARVPRAIVA